MTILAPGIVYFDTPSHGGVWLSPEQNAKVPMSIKRRTFCGNGISGYYEEDQDLDVLARIFPDLFGYREGYSESLPDDRPVNKLDAVTERLMQDRPPMADDELEQFVNAHAVDGIVFKVLKHK